jgi:hypothetical protein
MPSDYPNARNLSTKEKFGLQTKFTHKEGQARDDRLVG